MGGIKKKKAKRGIEHHKRSLEETLEAPETYGVRVSEAPRATDLAVHTRSRHDLCTPHNADEDKTRKTAKGSCLSSSGRGCRRK